MNELISVIVTTYNREDALDAVLRSLAHQSDQEFEVVVADDGSTAATGAVTDAWNGKVGRRLDHVWHEDRGFRAAEIRNRAILAARGAYCIFLDGDCIARPDFVATHRRLAEPGCFVTGNRILLSRDLTAEVLLGKLTPETWTFARWMAERPFSIFFTKHGFLGDRKPAETACGLKHFAVYAVHRAARMLVSRTFN